MRAPGWYRAMVCRNPGRAATKSVGEMRTPGFTLIEMLVALTVIAVVGLAVSSAVGNVVAQTYTLEQRMVAHWVAENDLARVRLARIGSTDAVPTGRETERVRMSGRTWRVDRNIAETTHPWLRRVEIEVYEVADGEDIGPLHRMVGFVGRY